MKIMLLGNKTNAHEQLWITHATLNEVLKQPPYAVFKPVRHAVDIRDQLARCSLVNRRDRFDLGAGISEHVEFWRRGWPLDERGRQILRFRRSICANKASASERAGAGPVRP